MTKQYINIIVCALLALACQDENTFGPGFTPDKMGHMMKVDQTALNFGATTDLSKTIQVRAKGPHWRFDGMPEWLAVSSVSGAGDMAVTLTAAANNTFSPRSATITFRADEHSFEFAKPISVRQEGITASTTAEPTALSFATDGGGQTVTVTSNEEWTATVNGAPEWCTVSPGKGSGIGSVTVTAEANETIDPRTATVTIKGQTSGKEVKVEVSQTGTKPVTTATPVQLPEMAAGGGEATITVTSNEEWTATVNGAPEWCTVSPGKGSGSGAVTLTVKANETIDPRTATVTIKGTTSGSETTVSVAQKGTEAYVTVEPKKWTATTPGAATLTVTVSSNTTWSVKSSDETWCTVTPATAATATISITANTSTRERKATLTFTAATKEATVEVTQAGQEAELYVSPALLQFERVPGDTKKVAVTSNEEWSATVEGGNAAWCHVTDKTATTFTVTADENRSFSSRSATITVTSTSGKKATIAVSQKGGSIGYEDYDEDTTVAPSDHAPAGARAVDLGLPSGTKWANMNIGATAPEGYGDYFAWGETTPKTTYSWGTYKYCNGSSTTMTKYCTSSAYGTVDGKRTLELADDAARANWGGSWQMPTYEDFQELLQNTTSVWTTVNGVNGRTFTSKVNSNNSIFLPAAGSRYDGSLGDQGTSGLYWSSTVYPSYSYYARSLYFYSWSVSTPSSNRYYGRSVRAVLKN